MSYVEAIVNGVNALSMTDKIKRVKKGDIINITPIDKVPNCERQIKVDEVTSEGFLYGVSTTCDGWIIPFYWIKDFEIESEE